jgi:hypothetical protein
MDRQDNNKMLLAEELLLSVSVQNPLFFLTLWWCKTNKRVGIEKNYLLTIICGFSLVSE